MPAKTATLKAKGLIFDLDGTLISTLEVTEKIYTKHAAKYNIDPAPILAHCHGVPTQEVLKKFYPTEMHTVEKALELEKEAAEILDGVRVIPGASELLASLPAERWSIFTSGLPLLAHPRMRRLQLPIPSVFITPLDITNGKPHPEGYIRAAKDLGFNAKDCIVFEDAHAGTKAGHDSGATVIGIRTLLSEAQLKEAGADYTVRDMSRVSVCVDQTTGDLTITLNEE
ncbi:HAD-superfamily hydrolase subfamily IA, variant 3 [Linderina pennispora]|uniref:HAD-superfamily hydrolase subfamily IA, variant 3 n=1 Tax=Linderina pennispora TaxID=61395 RepID=A0A1Y1VQI9_9FUNG|nr:HAD-superfamily hydrolase subfamily IA, variant 3 [Linderina pennispora]ORX63413.1 HAD-superfamily hydrolase subfamily IA, variant 3 [Linderina pennispora]